MSQRDTVTSGLKRAGDARSWCTKRTRYDQTQVVPNLDALQSGSSSSASRTQSPVSDETTNSDFCPCPTWLGGDSSNSHDDYVIPKPGTPVDRKVLKRVGKYLLGPKIGNGPVECITQYLARREGTDQFFHLKMLVLDATEPQSKKTAEGEKQAKLLLHSEYQLLKMLENEEGVIRAYDLFMDSAFEEEPLQETASEYIYTGRVKRRIVLAVDCLAPHDFDDKSNSYINLQQYVIREKNLSEMKTLLVFYEIIKIVENLHKKNIVHRDLKLRNIILNTTTNRVVITNFCLGKQLLNENDYLHDQRGSPAYISPDVLSASHQKPYKGKPSDIWALGVVLYTMLYSQFPFFETKPAALFKRIKSVDYKIPKHTKVSEGTQYLIKNMLLLNPDQRLTATKIREQIERMISNKRQFFLRVDQMVPEIDAESHAKGKTTSTSPAVEKVQVATATLPLIQEPTFELSRGRFTESAAAATTPREGVFLLPKRDRTQMGVHRVDSDARLLTGDEWGQFSRIIREHGGIRASPPTSSTTTATTVPSAAAAAATPPTTTNNSSPAPIYNSTMLSRFQARNNAVRGRQFWSYSPATPASRSPRNGSTTPQQPVNGSSNTPNGSNRRVNPIPPPRRTADPLITGVAVAGGSPAAPPTPPVVVRDASRGVYVQRGGRSVYIPRVNNRQSPFWPETPPPTSANSSLLTIRLRPQITDNLNQMLARIDRILSNRLDEAAREFCSTLSDMFSRGRIQVSEEQNEFNGVLTTELAEQIGDWLLQDCAETVIVRDIFGDSTVNAKEKVVELFRRCGVQIEMGPTIEIKRAQNFDSIVFLSYILQASGYSSSYFA